MKNLLKAFQTIFPFGDQIHTEMHREPNPPLRYPTFHPCVRPVGSNHTPELEVPFNRCNCEARKRFPYFPEDSILQARSPTALELGCWAKIWSRSFENLLFSG